MCGLFRLREAVAGRKSGNIRRRSPFAFATMPAMSLPARLSALLLAAVLAPSVQAQPAYCASDGQPRPRALLERFISADCEGCWRDTATPRPGPRELAIDWIVPGQRGDDPPLSAAATREALSRLEALRQEAPQPAAATRTPLVAAARTLRVAHGVVVGDYVGTSIELKPAGKAPWTAWLLLVETLPAGTEGSPVERNLVRGVFQPAWELPRRGGEATQRLFESRPMRVPEGARPERLRVVGWVEDARGRIRAISESRCAPVEGGR